MQERITPQEFTEWNAFLELEPQGGLVEEARFALLTSLVAAAAGSDRTEVKQWRGRDFMSLLEFEDRPRTIADHRKELDRMRLVVRALAGAKLKKKTPEKRKGA